MKTLNRITLLIVALGCLIAGIAVPGCGNGGFLGSGLGATASTQPTSIATAQRQLATEEQAWKIAEDIITDALVNKIVTQAEYAPYYPYIKAGRGYLATAEGDVAAGKTPAQTDIDSVGSALSNLAPILGSIGHKKAVPAAAAKVPVPVPAVP